MKKVILIIISVFAYGQAQSQTTVSSATNTQNVNFLTKWTSVTGTPFTIGNSVVYDNGSYVGIGMVVPGSKLHVNGNTTIGYSTSTPAPANGLLVSGSFGLGTATVGSKLQVNGNAAIGYSTSTPAPANGLLVSGSFGLGTATVGSKLQVNGNAAIGYSASTAAPANGLLVSGNVGIGTSVPTKKLEVSGDIRANGMMQLQGHLVYCGNNAVIDWGATAGSGDLYFRSLATLGNAYGTYYDLMIVKYDGKVGIGTNTPTQKLEILHNDATGGIALTRNASSVSNKSEIKFCKGVNQLYAIGNDIDNNGHQTFFIWDQVNNRCPFLINEKGKVCIGGILTAATTSIYQLYVEGGIATRDVKVTATTFPDYVFHNDYDLLTISELETFIKHNGHLPGIPSAKEVEKNEGFELGDMQQKLLKTIEEQALYIIDLQKQITEIKEKLNNSHKN